MSENDFIKMIKSMWPADDGGRERAIALTNKALKEYPESAKLLCLAGDLARMKDDVSEIDVKQSQCFYETAMACDPGYFVPYESLGYLHDVYNDNFELAEKHFRQSIFLGSDRCSYIGLARVLAQNGQKDEAIQVLVSESCPRRNTEPVLRILCEIRAGQWDPT